MPKSKIIIKRKSEWNNRMRSIGIYLDGKRLDKISNGEIKEFEVESGVHVIDAQIDWCGSRKMQLDLKEGETITLELAGTVYLRYLPHIALALIAAYFFVGNLNFEFLHILWVISPLMFLQLFFLTFGKDNYLVLKFL